MCIYDWLNTLCVYVATLFHFLFLVFFSVLSICLSVWEKEETLFLSNPGEYTLIYLFNL